MTRPDSEASRALKAAQGGEVQEFGRIILSVEEGPSELKWTLPAGLMESADHYASRGQRRLSLTMPVHARPKILFFVLLLVAVAVSVIVGLLAIGTQGTDVPIGIVTFVAGLPAFAAIGIGIQLVRVTETICVDSHVLTVTDEPYEFVVCRSHVAALSEIPRQTGFVAKWSHPRIALEPAGSTTAQALPLCGSGLTDPEVAWLLDAANEFLASCPAEETFACASLAGHPGLATLTASSDLR